MNRPPPDPGDFNLSPLEVVAAYVAAASVVLAVFALVWLAGGYVVDGLADLTDW